MTLNRQKLWMGFALLAALAGGVGGFLYGKRSHPTLGEASVASAKAGAEDALSAAGMGTKGRAATEAVVRAYLLEHPETITDAMDVLQKRQTAKRIASAGEGLITPFAGDFAANPKGDVTLVEFIDYNCGYCRVAVADVQKLVGQDKGVKLVFRELPILNETTSRDAARWGLAAARQGKHRAFHDAMYAIGHPDDKTIRQAATKAGLDIARAERDANSPEISAEIEANLEMMSKLGFTGTPAFIVGNQIVSGAQGYEALAKAVAAARKEAA